MDTQGESIYNPAAGLRGDLSEKKYSDSSGIETDSCGMSERGHHTLLRVFSRQGEHGISYGAIYGYSVTKNGFSVRFSASLEIDGKEREGMWRMVVTGTRLDSILRHVSLGCRTKICESGPVDDMKKPEITRIEISEWEPGE